MAFIRGIIGFILAVSLTAFAIFNRHNVEVHLSPLHAPFEFPLYLIALSLTGAGFILGGFFVWLNGASTRRTGRKQRKIIKALEKELAQNKEQPGDIEPPPADFFPSVPRLSLPRTLQSRAKDSNKAV